MERERAAGREVSVAPLPIFSAATRATSFILAHFLTLLQACSTSGFRCMQIHCLTDLREQTVRTSLNVVGYKK